MKISRATLNVLLAAGFGASAFFTAGCSVQTSETVEERTAAEPAAEAAPEIELLIEEAPGAETAGAYSGSLTPFFVRAAASSFQEPKLAPELAFDGKADTRWASNFRDNEWIEGYFDHPVRIQKIEIAWETARAADFTVYLADRRTNWVEMGRRTDAVGTLDTLTFADPALTTALRIECKRRATAWGNSIFEVAVEGTADRPPPATSLKDYQMKLSAWQVRERNAASNLMAAAAADPKTSRGMSDDAFLDLVERRSFDYFWWESHPSNGLTRDRGRNFESSEECYIASVAAVGFALTAYPIGVERGWITREEGLERTRITLNTFLNGPVRHIRGFFPHFVDIFSGADAANTEISTIDTALFLAGMIVAIEYFKDPGLTAAARTIMERVEWDWARNGHAHFVTHGTHGDGRFLDARWGTVTEGLLIYLLGLGSPTHPLPPESWHAIDRVTGEYRGYRFLIEHGFQSIFRYQYPALWYDFRGRTDRSRADYFENVTLAVLAMREYCINNADSFPTSYGPDSWGLGAADGPGDAYMIYGFPPGNPYSPTDGSVIPYAIAGSIPFLPQHSIRALRNLYDNHHQMWGKYGFADSVNPHKNFVARDAIGLDAGTILLGIENYRSRMVWRLFMQNEWIQQTTRAIGWTTRPVPWDDDGPIDLARDIRWRFTTGGGDLSSPQLDDRSWQEVVVPDFWENYGSERKDFDGVGWFRATIQLDSARLANWTRSGRRIVLRLGGVDDSDAAYVNGVSVGATSAGAEVFAKPRVYNVPPALLRAGRNVIAIRVTDVRGFGGIWKTPVELGVE